MQHNMILVAWLLLSIAIPAWADVIPDVVYGHKDGMALTYDVLLPEEQDRNGAGVMFMVSGGWYSRWFDPSLALAPINPLSYPFIELLREGYVVYLVRHGSAPRYKVPDAVADVKKAVSHVRKHAHEHGVDSDRIGVFGGSAGGHLSLILGTMGKVSANGEVRRRAPVAAVVALYPPTDLDGLVGPSRAFPALDFAHSETAAVSPLRHVDIADAPVLLIHGDKDRLVPLKHSTSLQARLEEVGVESRLEIMTGEGHGFSREGTVKSTDMMIKWFDDHLGDPEVNQEISSPPDGGD